MKKRLISIFIMFCIAINIGISTAEGLNLSADSYILIDATSGRIIEGKNICKKLPIASTTKIMTALIAVEEGNLKDKVRINNKSINIEGSSIYLQEGEILSLSDLLYGLMLRSGNDSSIAIANHIAKTEEDFIKMMNLKARSIGALNTNFTNPHGLNDKNHYSTAYDLAIITKKALENEDFRKIFSSKDYRASREKNNYFVNKNKTLWEYEGGNGGKTGYTLSSGRCLVSTATRNDMQLIAVSLNAPDWFNDNYKLMDYGFENLKLYTIYDKNQLVKKTNLDKQKNEIDILTQDSFVYPLYKDERDSIKIKLELNKDLSPPINKGQYIGTIETYLKGVLIKKSKLISNNKIKNHNIIQNFFKK